MQAWALAGLEEQEHRLTRAMLEEQEQESLPSTEAILRSLVSKAFPDLAEVNDEAGRIARRQAVDLAVGFNDAKRKRVRGIVARAVEQGWGDQELELKLAETVGLDPRYQQAVERLHASQLKAGVPRGVAYRNKLDYARRLRLSRARRIARTEISMALNGAQRVLWQQGQASGEISPYGVRITHTNKGSACKERCARENGRRRSLKTTQGGPPFHPNCECWETLEDRGTPVMDRPILAIPGPPPGIIIQKSEPLEHYVNEAREELAKRDRLNWSPGKNWVERAGGLPKYMEDVALALIRDGMAREKAIPIAIGQVKRWAAGGSNVEADTRAKAIKAVAQWTHMKAKAKG